jgi:hypothetical protein
MRVRMLLSAGLVLASVFGGPAGAADLVSLDWGEFNLDAESAVKPKTVTVKTGKDQLSLSMELDSLVANADGVKTEASSSFAGQFSIQQPDYVSLPSIRFELRGLIVKTAGSTASLDVSIGSMTKTISWKEDEVLSEPFSASFSGTVPDGQLPSPLPISVLAFVKKAPGGGAVLVSLEKIDVQIGQVNVAGGPK